MKHLVKFTFLMTIFSVLMACDSSDGIEMESLTPLKHDEMKTLGFNVVFTGEYQSIGPDETNCPGMIKVINTGEGTGTHFKKLTSYFEFCVNPADNTYPHGYMVAYFQDEDGDKLFVSIESGQVLPGRVPGMPNYAVSYFTDNFTITGGTGKFMDAEGSGVTNDYNFEVQ